MKRKGRRSALLELRREELTNRVLQAIMENRDGLTWSQVGLKTGGGLPRSLLTSLQKDGKIKQKKRMLPSGRISHVYVLNDRQGSSR